MKRRWVWLLAAVVLVLPLFGVDGLGVAAQDGGTPAVPETPVETPTAGPTETPTETTPTETVTEIPTATPSETVVVIPSETATEVPTPAETAAVTVTPVGTAAATPVAPAVEPAGTTAGKLSDIVVTLSCRSNPEQTRIDNRGSVPIVILSIRPYTHVSREINRRLGAGRTVIFRSGTQATTGEIIAFDELYDDRDGELAGIEIVTTIGTINTTCPPVPRTGPAVNLRVTISCRTNPETTRVDNIGTTDAVITGVRSLILETGTTPIHTTRKLGAGKTVIFRTGTKATSGTVLTTLFLYDDNAYEAEGAEVRTTSGQVFTDRCDPKTKPTPTPTPSATPTVYPSLLNVSVNCYGAPETITIRNVGQGTVTIATVGSLYQPLPNEPYRVNRSLGPGQSITYQTGSGAVTNRLTGVSIFSNVAGSQEGVRVVVSTGKTFTTRCG